MIRQGLLDRRGHKMVSLQTICTKYRFQDRTGYIVAPGLDSASNDWAYIRLSASVPPWVDQDVHLHTGAEEYFFGFQGELRLLVGDSVFTVRPYEALLVRPEIPHSVVGGSGPIEHFVLRVLASDDRRSLGAPPAEFPPMLKEETRALELDWGCRVPLEVSSYQNCWLFGFGQACFASEQLFMAYRQLPTQERIEADHHPHYLHLHQESWEYYIALQGTRVLQIEGDLVEVSGGELLEVPPGTQHILHATHPPFQGIEFRVPRRDDKVVI